MTNRRGGAFASVEGRVGRRRRAGLHDAKGKALFHLHDLRRTAATLARERGVPVEVIRDQLGHGHERMTTRHYIRARTNPNLGTFAAVMDGIARPEAG